MRLIMHELLMCMLFLYLHHVLVQRIILDIHLVSVLLKVILKSCFCYIIPTQYVIIIKKQMFLKFDYMSVHTTNDILTCITHRKSYSVFLLIYSKESYTLIIMHVTASLRDGHLCISPSSLKTCYTQPLSFTFGIIILTGFTFVFVKVNLSENYAHL